ncbi:MAG TPA: hypothetical protein VG737_03415 [Cyclobacteriaceae bacterium]|nr:hypothetical protein [Cyclobacteriaceae bacterium]
MKNGILTVLFTVLTAGICAAQTFTETIKEERSFEKKAPNNAVMIFNINGDVSVEGYNGDKIIIEVEKRIKGKTEARLQQGKEEIQLGIVDRADTLILYVKGVCNEFGRNVNTRRSGNRRKSNGWGYNWNDCNGRDCEKGYDYTMNFKVKVPASANTYASTVNDGDIDVININGYLTVDNINGSISLKDISGGTNASSINGNVDLVYSGNPPADSRYYALNGDINATFRKGLAAQLTFKSFNGEFYSSVEEITPMAVSVEKYEKGEGIHYRVNGNKYKVRQGGPLLDFETFNGDVILKEKTN